MSSDLATTIARLRELEAKATPGPWESDAVKTDGSYGEGDNDRVGFHAQAMVTPAGECLFDSTNSDAAWVEEECDEDGHYAWDAVAKRNFDFVKALRNAAPALLDAAERAEQAEAERDRLAARVKELEAAVPRGLASEAAAAIARLTRERDEAQVAFGLRDAANTRADVLREMCAAAEAREAKLREALAQIAKEQSAMTGERDPVKEAVERGAAESVTYEDGWEWDRVEEAYRDNRRKSARRTLHAALAPYGGLEAAIAKLEGR